MARFRTAFRVVASLILALPLILVGPPSAAQALFDSGELHTLELHHDSRTFTALVTLSPPSGLPGEVRYQIGMAPERGRSFCFFASIYWDLDHEPMIRGASAHRDCYRNPVADLDVRFEPLTRSRYLLEFRVPRGASRALSDCVVLGFPNASAQRISPREGPNILLHGDEYRFGFKAPQPLPRSHEHIEIANLGARGNLGNRDTENIALSPDASRVLFASISSNLNRHCENASDDVFLRDRRSGLVKLLSPGERVIPYLHETGCVDLSLGGTAAVSSYDIREPHAGEHVVVIRPDGSILELGPGWCPSLDAAGSRVAFWKQQRGRPSIRLLDVSNGRELQRIDVEARRIREARLSGNGRFIATQEEKSDHHMTIVVRSAESGGVVRRLKARPPYRWIGLLDISAKGDEVLFYMKDAMGVGGLFVGRPDGASERVDVKTDGTGAGQNVLRASLSADGRFVVFASNSSSLVPADEDAVTDVFLRDLKRDRTWLISRRAIRSADCPTISDDGSVVGFCSRDVLIKGDHNLSADVFLIKRKAITR